MSNTGKKTGLFLSKCFISVRFRIYGLRRTDEFARYGFLNKRVS